MPFDMGSVFSPQVLSLVQQQQRRQDGLAGSRKRVRQYQQNPQSDTLLRAQLAAEEAEKDRELKRELAAGGFEADKARLEAAERARLTDSLGEEARMNERSSLDRARFEEGQRQFDETTEIAGRRADSVEELRRIQNENNMFKQVLEFGGLIKFDEEGNPVVDETVAGSKGAKRKSDIALDAIRGEKIELDMDVLEKRIDGTLPEILDKKKRTEIMEESLNLRREALVLSSGQAAEQLALKVWNLFRDPMFGGFGNQETMSSVKQTAAELMNIISTEKGDAMAEAFSRAYQREGEMLLQSRNAEAVQQRQEGERKKRAGRTNSGDDDLDAFAAGAVPNPFQDNPPPNNVGR